jgi:transport inhibitor response 1
VSVPALAECLIVSNDCKTGQVVHLEGNNTLNEGIRALLQGCPKVRRLALCFCNKFGLSNVVVTEDGIRYIGKYGTNLRMITLTNCGNGSGESLSYIAMGCLQLRKLELLHCMFTDASKSSSFSSPCPHPPTSNEVTGLFWYCKISTFVYLF